MMGSRSKTPPVAFIAAQPGVRVFIVSRASGLHRGHGSHSPGPMRHADTGRATTIGESRAAKGPTPAKPGPGLLLERSGPVRCLFEGP